MTNTYILEQAEALQTQIVAWRRDFHQYPELGFEETRTANIVAEELRALGLEVEVGVGKTGVVGHLGEGGKVVGIRADMDALPVQELNNVPYASQVAGKMHACGHDAHTAILMGVARILAGMPDRPPGEIRFLFQPSEEKQDDEDLSGAPRMIDDGALTGVDYTLALHVSSQTPVGKIEVSSGFMSANVDTFFASIRGVGCHGASPHRGIDPIYIAAQVVTAIHTINSRYINPIRPSVISVGSIHGGDANNVIPAEVKLTGTVRSYDDETRQELRKRIENAFRISQALGGDYEIRWQHGYPSMYNDPFVTEKIQGVTTDYFGEGDLLTQEPMMGGEDFSYMQQQAAGTMFLLGVQVGEENRPHHSPIFDIDEAALYRGAAILAETACRLLAE